MTPPDKREDMVVLTPMLDDETHYAVRVVCLNCSWKGWRLVKKGLEIPRRMDCDRCKCYTVTKMDL